MPHPAVEFAAVTYRYPGADAPAVQDVSLRVEPGERLGILGPNGGGKSTLLKLALGLLPCQQGTIRVMGRSPRDARSAGLVGYVPQQLEADRAFPLSVRQVVELGAGWRTAPYQSLPASAAERVSAVLDLVAMGPLADRPIGALSGGQTQRVMIARALAAEPRILALDEPTVGIDAVGQVQFGQMLDRVHRELGVTILIISHDLRAITAGCDRVACLARRLHSHVSPGGLTPAVLAELFSHDVAGLAGLAGSLAGVHIHAHGAGEACPIEEHAHPHPHAHSHEAGHGPPR